MPYIQTCFAFSSDITRELELIEMISLAVLATCYFPDVILAQTTCLTRRLGPFFSLPPIRILPVVFNMKRTQKK